MSLTYPGHHLSSGAGQASWFDDLRVTMKANRAQTGGAYTMWEFIIPSGYSDRAPAKSLMVVAGNSISHLSLKDEGIS